MTPKYDVSHLLLPPLRKDIWLMKLRKCSYCSAYWLFSIALAVLQGTTQGQSIEYHGQILPLCLDAYRKEFSSPFSAALRPAAWNYSPKRALGLYAENRFMLRQVADMQAAASIPLQSTVLSISGHYKGTRFLSAQSIGVGLGMKLSARLSAGINISSQWMRISSVGSIHSIVVDGGLLYAINEKVLWGIHVRKGVMTTKTHERSREKPQLIAGIGYALNKQLFIAYEISATSANQLISAVGIEWRATEKIHFRAGSNHPLNNLFIGAAKKGNREKISLGFSSHAMLGYSGAILLEHALQ